MSEPTLVPTRKVATATLAGAIASIVAWAFSEFHGTALPPGIEAALTTVIMAVVGYLVPNAPTEYTTEA